MKNNIITGIVIGAICILIGGFVGYKLHVSYPAFVGGATNNAAGTVFNTAKVAQVNITPTTTGANGTSTSILNTDATDRIITDTFVSCNGVGTSYTPTQSTGLATWQWQMATTATANPTYLTNTNYVAINTVATATPDVYTASTTIGVGAFGRVWATGSYLTIYPMATNTAACTAGVHYLGS